MHVPRVALKTKDRLSFREIMATNPPTQPTEAPRSESGGMGWRIAVSIISLFGLISFVLLYFAFWAGPYSGL